LGGFGLKASHYGAGGCFRAGKVGERGPKRGNLAVLGEFALPKPAKKGILVIERLKKMRKYAKNT